MPMRGSLLCGTLLAVLPCAAAQDRQEYLGDPIRYEDPTQHDPVGALRRRLSEGSTTLDRDPELGLLPALLEALDVPVSSQTLVFSKTSFQSDLISPRSPRAIYFGDDCYVGYVPGSDVIEVTAVDAEKGAIFYTVADGDADVPHIERRDADCLRCHAFSWTRGWPGHLVRSVPVDPEGHVIQRLGTELTTHDSPFAERWGGWYVTGTHGAMRHRGNVTLDADATEADYGDAGQNVTTLEGRFDPGRYPSTHSDVVALMVLEHQTWMHNLIAWADYEATILLERQRATNAAIGSPEDHRSDATRRRLLDLADELLRYLLFRDEAPLTAKVEGTSAFVEEFVAAGRKDRHGRSLREFDLERRLFRWPCSYVIESEAFARLHPEVRDIVLLRLHRILTGRFGARSYRHLSEADRATILAILKDTVPDLPESWRQ